MAINVYQVNDLMNNMFGTTAATPAGTYASEFALNPDNFNNNLARYTQTMGVWNSTNWAADQTFGNPAWTQAVGDSTNGTPWHAINSYYLRGVAYTNEANFWGYIASLQGGYIHTALTNPALSYTFDSTGSTIDYDGKLLGHGANVTYPMPFTQATQFRDSNNTPADATCFITSTGSSYTRSQYLPPSYFTLYITSATNNVTSGNVKFLFEQRPSTLALTGSRTLISDAYGDVYTATQQRILNRRRLSIFWGRIFGGASTPFYAYPVEEDGTNVGYAGTGHMNTVYHYSSLSSVTGSPSSRPLGDYRVRETAMFAINPEYYGAVQSTKAAILSNKTTTLPLVFFDLSSTWTLKAGDITNVALTSNVVTITVPNSFSINDQVVVGGLTTATFLNGVQLTVASASGTQFTAAFTHANYTSAADTGTAVQLGARIAGVTANAAKTKIYFLSERGDLAVYDFTVAGGAISALTSAPTLAAGEAYSALTLSSDGTKLYALNGSWSPDPTVTTAGTGRVGVTAYTIGAGTWGAANNSALLGRINGRSLHEMVSLRNGWQAILCEKVTVGGGNVTNGVGTGNTNIQWQLMVFDPAGPTWNTGQITAGGTLVYGADTSTWSANVNGRLFDIKTGKLLIQANWRNDALWVVDVSGTAAGLTDANLTAVGVGQGAYTIFPSAAITNVALTGNVVTITAPNSFVNGQQVTIGGLTGASFLNGQTLSVTGSTGTTFTANFTHANYASTPDSGNVSTIYGTKTQIRKSQSDDRTIFWRSEVDSFSTNTATPTIYLAPPSFAWTSGTLATLAGNPHGSSSDQIVGFDKDKYSTCNVSWGFNDTYSIFGHFNESYTPIIVSGAVYNNGGSGEWGIAPNNLYADHNLCGMVYLPTYYKTGNVLADSWADASTNSYSVPSTAGTNINLPYGLVVQFGPLGSNSYSLGDFHNLNVTYGSIKYQRKSRFTWSMFTGQTFQNTDSRAVSALNAIVPTLSDGSFAVALSGPSGITNGTNFYRTAAQWTQTLSGVPQNTPAVMIITCSGAPNPATLMNIPGDGKVITTSTQNPSFPATNAFNGNPNNTWVSTGSGTQYLQIDMGSAVTANAYSLRFNPNNTITQVPVSWTVQGSATGAFSGEQVTIDTQTRPSPLYNTNAFNMGSPGSYRYYRFVFTAVASNAVEAGSICLFSAVLTNTVNFSEIQIGTVSFGFERGLKFETSTDGTTYTTITPLWRSAIGSIWCFARQTGIQKVRITVQTGANQFSGGNTTGNLVMGPYALVDYGTQAQMDAARLGNLAFANQTPTDPRAGSFETQCIGIASDAVTISIDGDSPISRQHYNTANMISSFFDWVTVPALQYKVHPFWGFVILPGGGASSQPSTQTGTTATITYNWGRRV